MLTGRIFEIKRFAVHDGPGIRTTVFFKGCPLVCSWCHNPEGISPKPEIALLERLCASCGECFDACPLGLHYVGKEGRHTIDRGACNLCLACVEICMPKALKFYGAEYTGLELYDIVGADVDFYKQSGGGVTCSGGEPLMQADFLADFLRICKDGGLHTAVDTSGYAGWSAFEKVMPYTDLFLYDLKGMDTHIHKNHTGVDNQLILENLIKLSDCGTPVEIRMLVIPGINNSGDSIAQAAGYLRSLKSLVRVRVLAYHAFSGTKYASIGKGHNLPDANGGEHLAARRVADILMSKGLPVQGWDIQS